MKNIEILRRLERAVSKYLFEQKSWSVVVHRFSFKKNGVQKKLIKKAYWRITGKKKTSTYFLTNDFLTPRR